MSKRVLGFTIALLVMSATTGCGHVKQLVDPGPRLDLPDVSAGIGVDRAGPSVPYSFDDVPLCLDEPGSITIDSVELANATGGLELRRFSVRESPESGSMSYLQDQRTTLATAGYPADGPFTVDQVCYHNRTAESDDRLSLLGIEVQREEGSPDGPAYSTGLVVHYTSAGQRQSEFVGFAVLLCPGVISRRPDCDVHEVRPPD